MQWKVFSLTEINRGDDPLAAEHAESDAVLRAVILARRRGGNEAVDRFYQALGRARYDQQRKLADPGVVEEALEEAGLDRALLQAALEDPTTNHDALKEHREAVEAVGAFGVPWLVLDGRPFGFYGPIISEVPRGQDALDLWEHTAYFLKHETFFELKRSR